MKASKKEFIAEAEDLLFECRQCILEIQDTYLTSANPDTINALFRSMHTLKGLSGLLGDQAITDSSHSLEGLLDDIRLGKITVTEGVVNFLFKSIDILSSAVNGLKEDTPVDLSMQREAIGYGIRYAFGIFDQEIRNLGQVELPENWLRYANPWEISHPEIIYTAHFYGRVKQTKLPDGNLKSEWVDTSDVVGIPYDIPIAGYGNNTVNTLRLWSARASNEFDLNYFQYGDYLKAVEEKNVSENISKVLYPSDEFYEGRELRLKQQYFFVSCSIKDIIRRYLVTTRTSRPSPTKLFWSNEAISQLMMLAYNPFLLFKIDMLRTTEYRQQIKTFRLKYVFLAGKIIRTARSVVLKLSDRYPYREMYEQSLSG